MKQYVAGGHEKPETEITEAAKNRAAKRKVRQLRLQNFANDFGVYLICVVGVFASRMIPADFSEPTFVLPTAWQAMSSFFAAWLALYLSEREGTLEGKRANFKRRARQALFLGWIAFDVIERLL